MNPLDPASFESLLSAAPKWLHERRRAGFATFEELAMPDPKQEAWRYVDIPSDPGGFALPEVPAGPLDPDPFLAGVQATSTATIVDGMVTGIEGDAIRQLAAADGDGAAGRYGTLVAPTTDRFAAAHAAFSSDGVMVMVPRRAAPGTVVVDVQATQTGTVGFPHVFVEIEEGAEAAVVALLRGVEGDLTVVPQLELVVGDGARLAFTTVQRLGGGTTSVTHQRVVVGRDASVRLGEVGLGGRFARLDLRVDLEGNGGNIELVGLSFGERRQTLDYRLVITHQGRNTISEVFLKGAVEDQASFVFTGLLRIEKPALRSHAFETNRNLVLSEGAKAHSVPNLEILCNDVMCGHGSSVGPLEEEHLYYLQSRGLSRTRAERVLVRGFFEEVLRRFPAQALTDPLRQAVNLRFVEAQREGRVR